VCHLAVHLSEHFGPAGEKIIGLSDLQQHASDVDSEREDSREMSAAMNLEEYEARFVHRTITSTHHHANSRNSSLQDTTGDYSQQVLMSCIQIFFNPLYNISCMPHYLLSEYLTPLFTLKLHRTRRIRALKATLRAPEAPRC
jgi:hypothetical protein